MKTTKLILTFLYVAICTVNAQDNKDFRRITRIDYLPTNFSHSRPIYANSNDRRVLDLLYNDDNMLIGATDNKGEKTIEVKADPENDVISTIVSAKIEGQEPVEFILGHNRVSAINNGNIEKEIFTQNYSYSGYGNPHTYKYNDDNEITDIRIYYTQQISDFSSFDPDGDYINWHLTWENGNIISGELTEKGEIIGSFSCNYYETECIREYAALNTPLLQLITHFETSPLFAISNGYFGKTCKHLLKDIRFEGCEAISDKIRLLYSDDNSSTSYYHDMFLNYTFDGFGYPVIVEGFLLNGQPLKIDWETTSSISSIDYDNNLRSYFFDLQGRRLAERPERGIFIENGRKIAK